MEKEKIRIDWKKSFDDLEKHYFKMLEDDFTNNVCLLIMLCFILIYVDSIILGFFGL